MLRKRRSSVATMMGIVLAAALVFGALRGPIGRALLVGVVGSGTLALVTFRIGRVRITTGRVLAYVVMVLILPVVVAASISQLLWGIPSSGRRSTRESPRSHASSRSPFSTDTRMAGGDGNMPSNRPTWSAWRGTRPGT